MTDKPEVYGISPETLPDFLKLLDDYRAGKLHTRPVESTPRPQRTHLRLAKVTTSTITASGTGAVKLQRPDWTDSGPEVTVTNDYAVDLPVNTKLLVGPIQGVWRVVTVFNLTCPEV